MRRNVRNILAGAGAIALAIATLSGCSTDAETESPGSAGGGTGVPYGATMDEYHAAFAEVDPATLIYQFTGGEGSEINAPYEAYLDAVEEWSDGKVTFDRAYSSAIVPAATEWAKALNDGRIDLTYFIPYATPEVFPQLSQLAAGSFLDANHPVSPLAGTAAFTDAVYADEAFQDEADAAGVHLLVRPPNFNVGGYFCPEAETSTDDFSSRLVSIAGASQAAQVTALGATPQSVAFTELYEALQRGVVDCIATSVTTVQTFGATELVPNMSLDPDGALADFLGYYAIGKDKWDSLPLVAQQVLYDRLDVLLETLPRTDGDRITSWLGDVEALDGGITELDADALKALNDANGALLQDMQAAGIDTDRLIATRDEWQKILTEELYPELDVPIDEFLRDGAYSDVDLTLFTERLYEQLFSQYRPS